MTKHINPGTDATVNTVVIDDSYRERKQPTEIQHIYLDSAKPEDFMNANIGDWIQFVGDITTEYELKFIRNFWGFLCASHTPAHPPEAQQRIDAAIKELKSAQDHCGRPTVVHSRIDNAIALLQAGDNHE